ncbi:MAG: MTAP family purine nucleoside phosphorylase [Patescibacteria group bacterium]
MNIPNIAIIGGSGLRQIEEAKLTFQYCIKTPYGDPSSPAYQMRFTDLPADSPEFLFLHRHGAGHAIPPHQINELANFFALMREQIDIVFNFTAVGALTDVPVKLNVGDFALVTKVVDQTGPRTGKTFFQNGWSGHYPTEHVGCAYLTRVFVEACEKLGFPYHLNKTCVAIEGPQFANSAELKLYRWLGCDLIGMTQIPFAKLAIESNICVLIIAMVTDDATENTLVTGELVERRMKEISAKAAALIKQMMGSKLMAEYAESMAIGCVSCVHGPESIVTDEKLWTDHHRKLFELMFRRRKNMQYK